MRDEKISLQKPKRQGVVVMHALTIARSHSID